VGVTPARAAAQDAQQAAWTERGRGARALLSAPAQHADTPPIATEEQAPPQTGRARAPPDRRPPVTFWRGACPLFVARELHELQAQNRGRLTAHLDISEELWVGRGFCSAGEEHGHGCRIKAVANGDPGAGDSAGPVQMGILAQVIPGAG